MKFLGSEINEWYNKHFPKGMYHDESCSDFDSYLSKDYTTVQLPEEKFFDIDQLLGYMAYDDADEQKKSKSDKPSYYFKDWKKKLENKGKCFISFYVPKDKIEMLKQFCNENGIAYEVNKK